MSHDAENVSVQLAAAGPQGHSSHGAKIADPKPAELQPAVAILATPSVVAPKPDKATEGQSAADVMESLRSATVGKCDSAISELPPPLLVLVGSSAKKRAKKFMSEYNSMHYHVMQLQTKVLSLSSTASDEHTAVLEAYIAMREKLFIQYKMYNQELVIYRLCQMRAVEMQRGDAVSSAEKEALLEELRDEEDKSASFQKQIDDLRAALKVANDMVAALQADKAALEASLTRMVGFYSKYYEMELDKIEADKDTQLAQASAEKDEALGLADLLAEQKLAELAETHQQELDKIEADKDTQLAQANKQLWRIAIFAVTAVSAAVVMIYKTGAIKSIRKP